MSGFVNIMLIFLFYRWILPYFTSDLYDYNCLFARESTHNYKNKLVPYLTKTKHNKTLIWCNIPGKFRVCFVFLMKNENSISTHSP